MNQQPNHQATTATKAIIFHGIANSSFQEAAYGVSESPFGRHGQAQATVLTEHPIHHDKDGRPIIGAGRALGGEACRDLGQELTGIGRRASGFIPSNVLYLSDNAIIWHEPGIRRPMWFSHLKKPLSVVWPNLLFVAWGNQLHVFATAGKGRPKPTTPLYHAPLMNVWDSGQVCLGSASIPAHRTPDAIEGFNAAIFDTKFSHINHNHTLNGGASNAQHLKFWRDRQKVEAAPKAGDMVRFGRTVQDIIEGVA